MRVVCQVWCGLTLAFGLLAHCRDIFTCRTPFGIYASVTAVRSFGNTVAYLCCWLDASNGLRMNYHPALADFLWCRFLQAKYGSTCKKIVLMSHTPLQPHCRLSSNPSSVEGCWILRLVEQHQWVQEGPEFCKSSVDNHRLSAPAKWLPKSHLRITANYLWAVAIASHLHFESTEQTGKPNRSDGLRRDSSNTSYKFKHDDAVLLLDTTAIRLDF